MKWPLLLRRVVGYSMAPTLRPNQIVVAATFVQPKLNRIVIVRHQGKELIKRVVRIDDKGLAVTGDNISDTLQDSRLANLTPADVLAVVVYPLR